LSEEEKHFEITRNQFLEDLFKTWKNGFERQRMQILFSFEMLERIDNRINKKKCGIKLFALDENDEVNASAYLLWDTERIYYWLSGENPGKRKDGAGFLLVWEAIKIANRSSRNYFDFAGSMIETIAEVRRQFGAKQVRYSRLYKYKSKLHEIAGILMR